MTVSRRSFLQGSAAAGLIAATGLPGSPANAQTEDSPIPLGESLFFTVRADAGQHGHLGHARFTTTETAQHIVELVEDCHARDDDVGHTCSRLTPVPAGAASLEVLNSTNGPLTIALFGTQQPRQTRQSPLSTIDFIGIPVVSRAGWGADEALMTWNTEFSPTQLITVHHTASPTGFEPEYIGNYPEAVRSIYHFHATNSGRGWGDIGYHFLIDPDGTIYQGRCTGANEVPLLQPESPLGAGAEIVTAGHVYGANAGNIGICLIGNFMQTAPTTRAFSALRRLTDALCHALELDPGSDVRYVSPSTRREAVKPTLSGHRDWADYAGVTECPGNLLADRLNEIRTPRFTATGSFTS
ncbi:N-acetylmuramoyl-L-alanine amidase [Rhodococcus qingshengii]|uniref:N-acetylmuramoyl-L-alanine amidase n=1 Tax=Rhodococcus qingshengii TaxID=334542 RepID=A0AAW6LL71_RHOSG|nr:N-acetylmuramoyl-L-alanine amidase [Rhodococcus qingshengii]MDE8647474.1 N-acetylmuramoyl-L-alanine amidase [Rhodococcus qingshengii]